MPSVREQFKTFHDFASADIGTIYGDRLDQAIRLEINTAATGIFINDGTAHFTFQELPHLAQISPTMGAVATHLDGDGKLDLVLAQNNFTPQRETGRMDGGLSTALLGNGDGTFRMLPPETSGLVLSGDARSASIVDFLGNHRPDLLIARNSSEPQIFFNNAAGNFLAIDLQSEMINNRRAIGARLIIHHRDGTKESCQVTAGCGYLSQSATTIFVSFAATNPVEKATVAWPDGRTGVYPLPSDLDAGGSWKISEQH